MHIKKCCIILILLQFVVNIIYSQEVNTNIHANFHTTEDCFSVNTFQNNIRINKHYQNIEVHFKFDKFNLVLDYMGNNVSLQKFSHKIDSIGISNIDSIVIVSQSSPEGAYGHNLMLSRNRANTMLEYIYNSHPELSNRVYVYPDGESWTQLREFVKKDTLMGNATKEKVISIIDADVKVEIKKRRLEQLSVYRYLLRTYYPQIRNSKFYILYHREIIPMKEQATEPKTRDSEPMPIVDEIIPDTSTIANAIVPEAEKWTHKLHLKTNAIGLGMAMVNIAAEYDLAKHWSFTLPVYFSAWDYFKPTLKFRLFAMQPEFRYWPSKENNGFFTGAHFGLAYYNFAFGGNSRYQDHGGKTPAIGGGVSIGYRLPVSKNNRWQLEFSLGAGIYPIHYDKFHNTPCIKDGQIIESVKKTYWGIDHLAISLAYPFNQKKKGSKQ